MQADEGNECMIGKEQYGTPSPITGTVEKINRFPRDTNHTVGSTCIKTCLEEQNICPVYHHELDTGIGLPQLQHLCQRLCNALGFDAPHHPVRDIASQVAKRVWYSEIIQAQPTYEENLNLAAACVYMASNLVFWRVRVRDIVFVSPLSKEGINNAYSMLLEELDDIMDEQLCWRVGMYNLAVTAG